MNNANVVQPAIVAPNAPVAPDVKKMSEIELVNLIKLIMYVANNIKENIICAKYNISSSGFYDGDNELYKLLKTHLESIISSLNYIITSICDEFKRCDNSFPPGHLLLQSNVEQFLTKLVLHKGQFEDLLSKINLNGQAKWTDVLYIRVSLLITNYLGVYQKDMLLVSQYEPR